MNVTEENIENVVKLQHLHSEALQAKESGSYPGFSFLVRHWNTLFNELRETIGMEGIFTCEDILNLRKKDSG